MRSVEAHTRYVGERYADTIQLARRSHHGVTVAAGTQDNRGFAVLARLWNWRHVAAGLGRPDRPADPHISSLTD